MASAGPSAALKPLSAVAFAAKDDVPKDLCNYIAAKDGEVSMAAVASALEPVTMSMAADDVDLDALPPLKLLVEVRDQSRACLKAHSLKNCFFVCARKVMTKTKKQLQRCRSRR